MKKYGLRYMSKEMYSKLLSELCDYCSEKFVFYRKHDVEPFVPCDNCLETTVWVIYREEVKKEKQKLFLFY